MSDKFKKEEKKQEKQEKRIKRYEDVLKEICNVDNLYHLRRKEWEGCLGVAMVLAFIKGVDPTYSSLSGHLGIPPYDKNLSNAFERLKINGIFNKEFGIKDDPIYQGGENFDSHEMKLAYCNLAGVAGGFIGLKENNNAAMKETLLAPNAI